MGSPDESMAVQLRLIGELTRALQAAGIPHWLFGGWVVDFLAEAETRAHSDVDLMIWQRDGAALRELLAGLGYWEDASPSGPELDARFWKEGQRVEFMFVREGEEGGVYWDQWRLPEGALGAWVGRLGEIVCPVISPETLFGCKEVCAQQETEPGEREKHARDVERLREFV
jgi:aminoglycoside-2''-adenylyltransferase